MMTRHFTLITSVVLVTSLSPVAAAESDVTIPSGDVELTATLNLPEGVERPPALLMLHGFTGQRQEFPIADSDMGLFAHTAEALADEGIATLRVDFAGSGESGGAWEDTTFSSQIADAVAAFDYLKALDSVDTTRVGILGYSQGGLVGAHLGGLRPEAAAVVLWAPVTNPLRTYAGLLGADVVEKALKADPAEEFTADLSWGGQTTLKATFFQDLVSTDPVGAIARYPGPLAVIVGTEETIVTPQPAAGQILLDYHEGEEELVEVESDHDWNALTTFDTVDSALLPATIDWFRTHLAE